MGRSKLEVASWVAGILSALLAAVAFLPKDEPGRSPSSTEKHAPQARAVSASDAAALPAASTASAPAAPVTGENELQLREALAAVKEVRSYGAQDEELVNIARTAMNKGMLDLAVEASRGIRTTGTRDKVLAAISCQQVVSNQLAKARSTAALISGYDAKDQALRTIASYVTRYPDSEWNCPTWSVH